MRGLTGPPRVAWALVVASLVCATRARAQHPPSHADAAAAEALFNEGKRLMTSGRYAAACPKFAESHRLDPGIGTMLWLGDCHAKNGEIASAWAIFKEAEALATKDKDRRAAIARDEAKKLEPRLSYLVIDVQNGKMPGLEIKRDGVALGSPLWGTPIPTDPGPHRIAASAPKHKAWEGEVVVGNDGARAVIAIPSLEDAPEAPPDPASAGASGATPFTPPPAERDPQRGSTQRILGLGLVGLGLVGVGVGTVFALRVKSKKDESQPYCVGNQCNQQGVDLRNDALDAATISNIAFIAGGVAVAAGAVLYLVAPKASSNVSIGGALLAGGGGALVRATF